MLDILVVATAMSAGALCGWWLRGAENRDETPRTDADDVDNFVDRLRAVAENVAVNLGEHHSRIGELHEQLKGSAGRDPEEILAVVTELLESNEWIQQQLHSAEAKLELQAEQIQSQALEARTDPLTQLANRRAFNDLMRDCQSAYEDECIPTTVMLIDVDRFKSFNDTHGHQAGDEVLRGVARVLRRHVPSGHLVARYGGEEIAVVFPGCRYADVRATCEAARVAIGDARFRFEGNQLRVTSSAGVAEFLGDEHADAVIRRADAALYASKEAGRNCGHFHSGQGVIPLSRRAPGEAESQPEQAEATALEPGAVDFEKSDFAGGVSTPEIFRADVDRRMSELRRGGASLSVLFASIDDFTQLVQDFGEDAGNSISRAVTLFIKASMRDMDHVARFSDGTFSLMLPGAKLSGAVTVAERIRTGIAKCVLPEKRFPPQRFTVSVGVAAAASEEDAEILLDRVRLSLEAATRHGRNCCYLHDGQMCHLIGAGHVSLGKP